MGVLHSFVRFLVLPALQQLGDLDGQFSRINWLSHVRVAPRCDGPLAIRFHREGSQRDDNDVCRWRVAFQSFG